MRILLSCALVLLLTLQVFAALEPHDPSTSIRDDVIQLLAAAGCTKRIVALQVIDIAQNKASGVLLNYRLDQLSGTYSQATLTKW